MRQAVTRAVPRQTDVSPAAGSEEERAQAPHAPTQHAGDHRVAAGRRIAQQRRQRLCKSHLAQHAIVKCSGDGSGSQCRDLPGGDRTPDAGHHCVHGAIVELHVAPELQAALGGAVVDDGGHVEARCCSGAAVAVAGHLLPERRQLSFAAHRGNDHTGRIVLQEGTGDAFSHDAGGSSDDHNSLARHSVVPGDHLMELRIEMREEVR